jgi:hypothetical protein
MTWYVVTYDLKKSVPDRHDAFLAAAGNEGWTTWCPLDDVEGRRTLHRLPSRTLMGQFHGLKAADQAFSDALENARTAAKGSVVVEKYLIVAKGAAILQSDETPPPPGPIPRK